jgi:hypothetical protein
MAEIRVHDDDEVARCELQAVDVGGSEAEFTSACADLDAGGCVDFLELGGDFLGSVWGAVVDDDEFPVEFAVALWLVMAVRCKRAVGVATYFSSNVLASSHVIMGRLRRSL